MNKTETKRKEPYEPPELLDIKPVTICTVIGTSEPDYNDDL